MVIWAPGSLPDLPSNLGMYEGNLLGTSGHVALCLTGSFINLDKSGKFKVSRKESLSQTSA